MGRPLPGDPSTSFVACVPNVLKALPNVLKALRSLILTGMSVVLRRSLMVNGRDVEQRRDGLRVSAAKGFALVTSDEVERVLLLQLACGIAPHVRPFER